jgi:hypothetical protein
MLESGRLVCVGAAVAIKRLAMRMTDGVEPRLAKSPTGASFAKWLIGSAVVNTVIHP